MNNRHRPAITALALILPLYPVHAEAQEVSVGGRIGLSAANVIFEDEHSNDRVDPRFGLQFGGLAMYRLTRGLSLQLEALYSEKGWTEFETGGARRITHLELPLLFGIHVPWNASPHILVGPFLSFELGCAITGVPGVGSVDCDDPQVAWQRKKVDIGYWLGLGLGRRIGRGNLDIELRGNLGLRNLNGEDLPAGYIQLGAVTLSAAYTVPIGGR